MTESRGPGEIAGPASPARAILDLVGLPCISDASQAAGVPGASG